jgi:hypothetical protein
MSDDEVRHCNLGTRGRRHSATELSMPVGGTPSDATGQGWQIEAFARRGTGGAALGPLPTTVFQYVNDFAGSGRFYARDVA